MSGLSRTELLERVTQALEDVKAVDIRILDVEALTTITSQMVVCTGTSKRHVQSLAENLIADAKHAGEPPLGVEGRDEGEWVLVDLGEIVVHIMQAQARALYQLEKLWTMTSVDMARAVDQEVNSPYRS